MGLLDTLTELRERIRQRVEGGVPDLPDFRPVPLDRLAETRAQAANWSAQVGRVNPRRGRPHDWAVQALKRSVARVLRWHTHPQQQTNAAILASLEELQHLLGEQNRNLVAIAQVAAQAEQKANRAIFDEARAATWLVSAQNGLAATRQAIEERLREQGIVMDGRIATNAARLKVELEAGAAARAEAAEAKAAQAAARLEEAWEKIRSLEYHLIENVKALNDSINKAQGAFWEDFERYRNDHVRFHAELAQNLESEVRLIRQRLHGATDAAGQAAPPARVGPGAGHASAPGDVSTPSPSDAAVPRFDYAYFEDRFRGSESEIRQRQAAYLPLFRDQSPVLDVACGRGEFLAFLKGHGVEVRGVDADPDMVARCRELGVDVQCADAFTYLEGVPNASIGGIFSAQFVEHLPTVQYVRLIQLAYAKLRHNGVLVLETQNPECLVTLARNFYVDPTHIKPVPHAQLRFWLEETGFRGVELRYVSPVAPNLPVLPLFDGAADPVFARWNAAAKKFNETYFGYQDYAITGRKL